jgi:hypothetical protein
MKICKRCQNEKPVSAYYRTKRGAKSYARPNCKVCEGLVAEEWRKANPEKVKTNQKRWESSGGRRRADERWRETHPIEYKLRTYRTNAKTRGLLIELTEE